MLLIKHHIIILIITISITIIIILIITINTTIINIIITCAVFVVGWLLTQPGL